MMENCQQDQQHSLQRRRKHTIPSKETKQQLTSKKRPAEKHKELFLTKCRAADLPQTKFYMENQTDEKQSLVKTPCENLTQLKIARCMYIKGQNGLHGNLGKHPRSPINFHIHNFNSKSKQGSQKDPRSTCQHRTKAH